MRIVVLAAVARSRRVDAQGYKVVIEPLAEEDGGGYLATVPDLPGCMSDGETRQEALANVEDAITTWIYCAEMMGQTIPTPAPVLTH